MLLPLGPGATKLNLGSGLVFVAGHAAGERRSPAQRPLLGGLTFAP